MARALACAASSLATTTRNHFRFTPRESEKKRRFNWEAAAATTSSTTASLIQKVRFFCVFLQLLFPLALNLPHEAALTRRHLAPHLRHLAAAVGGLQLRDLLGGRGTGGAGVLGRERRCGATAGRRRAVTKVRVHPVVTLRLSTPVVRGRRDDGCRRDRGAARLSVLS